MVIKSLNFKSFQKKACTWFCETVDVIFMFFPKSWIPFFLKKKEFSGDTNYFVLRKSVFLE